MARTVRDVMTPNPICCHPTDSVRHAAQLMAECHAGALPVVSDQSPQRIEGIITDRDICCSAVARGGNPDTSRVGEFMTRNVVSCRAEDDLQNCIRAMEQNQIRRVPVVDERGVCIGMVALADLALKAGEPATLQQVLKAVSRPSLQASVPRAA